MVPRSIGSELGGTLETVEPSSVKQRKMGSVNPYTKILAGPHIDICVVFLLILLGVFQLHFRLILDTLGVLGLCV